MVFSITYDLRKPNRNYDELYRGIQSFGYWWHQTGSAWIIAAKNKNPLEIRDYLKQFMDADDKLFVIAVQKSWAAIGFSQKEYDWMKSLPEEIWIN